MGGNRDELVSIMSTFSALLLLLLWLIVGNGVQSAKFLVSGNRDAGKKDTGKDEWARYEAERLPISMF